MKRAILLNAKEQFEANDYDPLQSMIDLAQKKRMGKQDPLKFQMHRDLARKYFPDTAALQVSGDAQNPLVIARGMTPEQRQARLEALLAKTNGHPVEAG